MKSIFKRKNTETHSDEVIYPHKTHKDFENEISMDGTLKNLDPTEILQSAKKIQQKIQENLGLQICQDRSKKIIKCFMI